MRPAWALRGRGKVLHCVRRRNGASDGPIITAFRTASITISSASSAAECASQHAATIAAAANHASGCTAQRGPTLLDRLRRRWHVYRLLRVGGCVLPSRIPVGECGMRLRHARVRVHSLLRATIWKRAAHAAASASVGAAAGSAISVAEHAASHAAAIAAAARRSAQWAVSYTHLTLPTMFEV